MQSMLHVAHGPTTCAALEHGIPNVSQSITHMAESYTVLRPRSGLPLLSANVEPTSRGDANVHVVRILYQRSSNSILRPLVWNYKKESRMVPSKPALLGWRSVCWTRRQCKKQQGQGPRR
eukprot:scaffold43213_cov19-Tisochrysis_lutea.AAC.3